MDIRVETKGLNEAVAAFKKHGARLPQAVGKALYMVASNIMNASQDLVPVDTGALRGSGFVDLPVVLASTVNVKMGYGGPAGRGNMPGRKSNDRAVGYAVYVHEILTSYHKVGQAKFLEQPVTDSIPFIPDVVTSILNAELGG